MKLPQPRGFTYIELLISTALVMLMFYIMFGPGSSTYQSRAKANCAENLRRLHMSLELYATEHNGLYPQVMGARTSAQAFDLLVPKYTADPGVFICPGSGDRPPGTGRSLAQGRISYAYYMGLTKAAGAEQPLASDEQVNRAAKTKEEALFSDDAKRPGGNHRGFGGNVLFADGHVETMPAHASRDLPCPPGVVLLNPAE